MPGFFGILNNSLDIPSVEIPSDTYTPVVCDEKKGPRYYFKRHVIPKFLNDKVFEEDASTLIGTDGVLLNSRQLREKYNVSTNFALIRKLYSDHGIRGISELKGNFSGFILDKKTGCLYVFTDHMRTKNVFWFFDEKKEYLVFGSELKTVISVMRKLGYAPSLCENGAYCLLTFGFMVGDTTLATEITKIPPGTILTYSEGKITFDRYYTFSSTPQVTDSEDMIIKKLESLYSDAIRLEYEKDLEYNYSHVATLSGGLDSRMNVMHAKRLGFTAILCICFSQNNYLDERIAKKIAADLGFDYIFHALDNGNFLKNIEEAVWVNDGLTLYSGAAHQFSTLKLLDWRKSGLLHTGILWFGPWKHAGGHQPSVTSEIIKQIAYSGKLLDEMRIRDLVSPKNYENEEIFSLYERGSNGVFNGYRVTEQYTEFSSPLHDRDFLAYALRLPPREDDYFYKKWILSEIPEAAEYPWEIYGLRITAGSVPRFISGVLRILRRRFYGNDYCTSMNPMEYWYASNPELRSIISAYYSENIGRLSNHPGLMKDAQNLYAEGTFLEKTQVVTLLAAMKVHAL